MPSFRRAEVTAVLAERQGLQRVRVAVDGDPDPSRAYVLTELVGPVAVGDAVIVNTTAVDLGLGTGGWHVVHWNLSRQEWIAPGPGHIVKLRYTSLQADTGAAEELHADLLAEADQLQRPLPVVACGLHSQVPCVAVVARALRPRWRIAYVMTDGASLPLAISELVPAMVANGLVDTTITAGHAFGGDLEAVNPMSALLVAERVAGADLIIVAPGPGVVGTASRLGFSSLELGTILDAASHLGGTPVAALRFSLADARPRHQGVSHHVRTALARGTEARAVLGVPTGPYGDRARADLTGDGLDRRHEIRTVDVADVGTLLAERGLSVTSMGRGVDDDPGFFALAGAAGAVAVAVSPAAAAPPTA